MKHTGAGSNLDRKALGEERTIQQMSRAGGVGTEGEGGKCYARLSAASSVANNEAILEIGWPLRYLLAQASDLHPVLPPSADLRPPPLLPTARAAGGWLDSTMKRRRPCQGIWARRSWRGQEVGRGVGRGCSGASLRSARLRPDRQWLNLGVAGAGGEGEE